MTAARPQTPAAVSVDDLAALSATLGLSDDSVARVRRGVADSGQSWVAVVARFALAEDRAVALALGGRYNLPFHDTLSPERIVGVSLPAETFLRSRRIAPLRLTESGLEAAIADPADVSAVKALQAAAGRPVSLIVAPVSVIDAALDRPADPGAAQGDDIGWLDVGDDLVEAGALRDLADQAPVIRLVDQLLADAAGLRASDVHLESARDRLVVRVRVDGVLRPLRTLPRRAGPAITSRIKVLAGMDVANRRAAQDGRATLPIRGRAMDVRVSTVPGLHGETVTVRLLDRDAIRLDLDRLGFSPDIRAALDTLLSRPQGLVLVTGPTGHGKTTTLYALLRLLNTGARKILTIEDPVEYELDGVTQVQVNEAAGVSFASGLRAFLRQDPDIILVGEIRDAETARIAAQAALTGHLVLATLHTNDAPSAIARLRDMGLEPFLIAATLSGVLAQRLVRTLCGCAMAQPEAPGETSAVRAAMDGQTAANSPVALRKPVGCAACANTGYAGRAAIAEAMEITPGDSAAITSGDQDALLRNLRQRGFRSLVADGAARAARGETTWTEVVRVAGGAP
ncbi:MAG: type II/IV secretion system protein [Hyphomonadaceae bacterium]|nr:type II/IV secretion system protein [Hyphomonadaceae bacterium]